MKRTSRRVSWLVAPALAVSIGAPGAVARAAEWRDDPAVFKEPAPPVPSDARLPQTPTRLALRLQAQELRVVAGGDQDGAVSIREARAPQVRGFVGRAGEPDVARRVVDVLLPYDADPARLAIAYPQPSEQWAGRFLVRPVARAATWTPERGEVLVEPEQGVTLDARGRDTAIYGKAALFPELPVRVVATGKLRQYRYVRLLFSPYRWNPVTGDLVRTTQLDFTLSWERRAIADPAGALRELVDPVVLDEKTLGRFVNLAEAGPWYDVSRRKGSYDYVIVLPRATKSSSTALSSFVAHKESLGHSVAVVTVESIGLSYSGSEKADKIRAFLRDKYPEWGIRYVLLCGDPDPYDISVGASDTVGSVPMKMAWILAGASPTGDASSSGDPVPTDHYYGDLSDEWDLNGDGYAASTVNDMTSPKVTVTVTLSGGLRITYAYPVVGYGFDFEMEVLVGRIPFDTVTKVDAVLDRTVAYETTVVAPKGIVAAARQRVYLAMSSFSDTADMSYLGRQIQDELLRPRSLTPVTLYEPGAACSSTYPLESAALITQWSSRGAGMVIWTGHGNTTYAKISYDSSYLMSASSVPSLAPWPHPFVFQGSCSNASPTTPSNLAHTLLEDLAIATVAGTTGSYYGGPTTDFGANCMIGDIGYWIAEGYASGRTAGETVSSMRSAVPVGDSWVWVHNLMTYNLYGDPSVVYTYN